MAALVTCYKCKKLVNIKSTALCSACDNRYELDCDGYPEHTYRLKDAESRKKWRCKVCIRSKKYANTDYTPNITVRKKVTPMETPSPTEQPQSTKDVVREDSFKRQSTVQNTADLLDSHVLTECETSIESHSTPNKLSVSVDGTVSDLVSASEMKEIIAQLSLKLEITENELGNILLENTDLHKQINKLTSENKTLKSLCQSPSIFSSPGPNTKKKRPALSTPCNILSTPSSLPSSSRKLKSKPNDNVNVSSLEQEIVTLQQQLKAAQQEIAALQERIAIIMQSSCNVCEPAVSQEQKQETVATSSAQTYVAIDGNNIPERKIFIFGTQRCVGLAAAISHSRTNTQYEKYRLVAETKPNAPSNEIIANCRNTKLTTEDKLVVCIGENDDNPNLLLSQLQIVLNTFINNTIIVLNVVNNIHLNVRKLNYSIKNVCNSYKNCHFVNQTSTDLSSICKSINYLIDCCDYSDKYLNPSEIRKIIASNKSSSKLNVPTDKPKKGTIPYYFGRIECTTPYEHSSSLQHNSKGQIGTIPYYFPVLNKRDSFFRISN